MPQFTGHCLCGKISYTAEAEPAFMGVCHCKDCQRATGSAFEAVIGVPADSVKMQGTPKVFAVKSDTGREVRRSFCPDCGSLMKTDADALAGLSLLMTGTLDDPSVFKPAMQIFCDSAQPWVKLGGDMQSFPRMPG